MSTPPAPSRLSQPVPLLAGFGKADITPAPDGTFRVFDPIYFRALHLRQGDAQVTLLAADLFLLDDGFEAMVLDELSDLNLPPGSLWCGASHLGTAPIFAGHYVLQPTPALRHFGQERRYARAAADVIRAAIADASPVALATAAAQVPEGLAFNRRAYDQSGRFTFVSLSQWMTAPDHLIYQPYDRQLGVVKALRPGKRPIVLLNFGCHALSLAAHLGHISGDFCGILCQMLDADGMDALFFQGALGDVAPNRVGDHPARHIAGALRQVALQTIASAAPVEDVTLRLAERSLELPLQPVPSPEQAREALDRAVREGRPDNTARHRLWLSERFAGQTTYPLRLRALSIGDTCLLHMPGEPFAHVALDLRAQCGFDRLMVLAGPCPEVGYLATPKAHREGENEAIHSTLAADTEPRIVATAAELIAELEHQTLGRVSP